MMARIVLGIILGFLILAYYPLILRRGWPFILAALIALVAAYFLRAAPMLAEPLGYGLLAALIFYAAFLLIRHKGNIKSPADKAEKIKLPTINIPKHQKLGTFLTLVLYTFALTFACYLIILLTFVK